MHIRKTYIHSLCLFITLQHTDKGRTNQAVKEPGLRPAQTYNPSLNQRPRSRKMNFTVIVPDNAAFHAQEQPSCLPSCCAKLELGSLFCTHCLMKPRPLSADSLSRMAQFARPVLESEKDRVCPF
jgi:hypothetical protein